MSARPIRTVLLCSALASLAAGLSGCELATGGGAVGGPQPTPGFANIGYANWSNSEPAYRLYPGDVLDVSAPSAPELARTVTVQPDGRIALPLIQPVMVANRSVTDVEATLAQAYSSQLLRPQIDVAVKQAAPLQIFVGGEVRNPGVYAMPGDINALQGVIMAGGFLGGSHRQEVVIIRRGPDGRAMMRTVDLRQAIYAPGAGSGDAVPLRRFDIIYVPRTGLAELGAYVSQIRDALPIQFTYVFGNQQVTN
jgi:protein involved in polysaccharide export with SLBB domain